VGQGSYLQQHQQQQQQQQQSILSSPPASSGIISRRSGGTGQQLWVQSAFEPEPGGGSFRQETLSPSKGQLLQVGTADV
jgi:hypothetical protein